MPVKPFALDRSQFDLVLDGLQLLHASLTRKARSESSALIRDAYAARAREVSSTIECVSNLSFPEV